MSHGEDKLHEFIMYLNNLHPTIKFTSSFSKSEISFLDVNVLLINGTLQTDLCVKPTDKHQYLLKSSCHPSHAKKSILYSMQALRQRRICLTEDFFNKRLNELTTLLINRGYKHLFIQQEINKVCLIPALPNINHIISGNLNILNSSQRCKEALPSPPLISYRSCNNLRVILVRAKHRRPPPPPKKKQLELSAVTEVDARRILLLQKEPRLKDCIKVRKRKRKLLSLKLQ